MEIIELDGTQLKFSPLTLADEDAWREWLRNKIKMDAKKDAEDWGLAGDDKLEYLAKISAKTAGSKCALLTPFGLEHAQTIDGTIEILRLAALHHHPSPGPDHMTLRRLVIEKREDVQRILPNLMPISPEKKVNAGPTAGPS